MKPIDEKTLQQCIKHTEEDSTVPMRTAAAARTELKDIAFLPVNAAKLNGAFSTEVENHGITAQEKSGRCWMFATLNIMRERVIQKCNLDTFTLSGNYLAFYDKLEKANNLLEMAIDTASLPLTDQKVEYILNGTWDGGYWNMARDLAEKYGVVPADKMPESYSSAHTETFIYYYNSILRKDMCELRKLASEGKDCQTRKQEMLAEIYEMEVVCFGKPPVSFHFEYRDKNGTYHSDHNLTPLDFYHKYVDIDWKQYVFICAKPSALRKDHQMYFFHHAGCMADKNMVYLNLPYKEMEELMIRQLKGNDPVWFGCDSREYINRKEGYFDPDSFAYDDLFGLSLYMNKKDRIDYHNTHAVHDMLLVGVNQDESGKPDRWKIENSWGTEAGKEGIFIASEKYFQEYVYEAVIHQKYMTAEQKELLKQTPVETNPWDEQRVVLEKT